MADMADDDREGNGAGDSGLIEQIQARIPRVEAALKAGRLAEALRLSLEDPPLSTKDSSIKVISNIALCAQCGPTSKSMFGVHAIVRVRIRVRSS